MRPMRDYRIDLLRFVGLVMIVFAHAGPPDVLFQLRNYDVPLMVLISGMSFAIAFKPQESYLQYVWKRVKRLVFPVWIFLTGYFLVLYLINPEAKELAQKTIVNSYSLLEGSIGFVWIIRVFLLVALTAPLIYRGFQKRWSDNFYLFILLVAAVVYEFGHPLIAPYIPGRFVREISAVVFYIVPYSLVFALGLVVPKLSIRKNRLLGASFLAVFGAIAFHLFQVEGTFVTTQTFKYPPRAYYFSYAIAISLFLWTISNKLWSVVKRVGLVKETILFMAQNSMWIYLWHIPLVKTLSEDLFFVWRFVIFLAIATLLTWAQSWLVHNVLMTRTHNTQLKKNLRSLLTG